MAHRLLLLILMLILPVQGIATVFAPVHKAMNTQAAGMPCHDAGTTQHDQTANASPAAPDTKHDSDTASHLCCHQVSTCVPTQVSITPAQKFFDVSRFVLPLATLFIPDSPDRPPRG